MKSHPFNKKNALYCIVYNYFIKNAIVFFGIEPQLLSKAFVKKKIVEGEVFVSDYPETFTVQKITDRETISIPALKIKFICIYDESYDDMEVAIKKDIPNVQIIPTIIKASNIVEIQQPLESDLEEISIPTTKEIDVIVFNYLNANLKISSLEEIKEVDEKDAFCFIVQLLEDYGFELIRNSSLSYEISDYIKTSYANSSLSKELNLPKNTVYFTGKFFDSLITAKNQRKKELFAITKELTDGLYDKSLFKFLQNYTRIVTSSTFQFLINPLLFNLNITRLSIENLIKPIYEAKAKLEIDAKYLYFEENKGVYIKFTKALNLDSEIHNLIYLPIVNYLQNLFYKECEVIEIKTAIIEILPTERKYNFKNQDRNIFEILLSVKNIGEGLARNIIIKSDNINFKFDDYPIGLLKPNEFRDITIKMEISRSYSFKPILNLFCCWMDTPTEQKSIEKSIKLQIQNEEVPWDKLAKNKPYTIQEIEEKDKLYGRDDILNELRYNILSNKIESYKIWGQKRVGKSSIVKTLKSLFNGDEKIIVVWRSIAGLKNTNPELTLNTLGESLCSEIFEEINLKIRSTIEREQLRGVIVPEFNGSLFPLEIYIKKLRRIDPTLKFVFILDEFDRINEEFFLPGKLGDTLSLNVGKGLNENSFIGFILVGSENMHLLDRQGINYNSYQEREIDTFDKETEYTAFKKIITGPVKPFIKYSDEAIDRVFSSTGGNPYFANLICSNIFKIAFKNKDNEIDINTVNKAIELIVNSSQKSHFEHFWSDGITEESNIKKEKKADIRRRILISYSNVYFQTGDFPDRQKILKTFNKPPEFEVENFEIENTIKEFFNRKIFHEEPSSKIHIKPSLFENWLCGPGRTLLIEGISDLEALHREQQLEEEYSLKNEELTRICENFIFKNERVTFPEIKRYFLQFGGPIEQRRIFKLIDSIHYLSKFEINEFIRKEQKNIFGKSEIELKIGAKVIIRDGVELYSFPKTLSENTEVVESFKILSHIRNSKTLKDIRKNKDAWKQNSFSDIIIFESVIADFNQISQDLLTFFDEKITSEKISVKLVVLLITNKAKSEIIKAMSSITNFKLIHYKEVEDANIKPFIETTKIFETQEELSYAFAEVRKHFNDVTNEAINVVFETHCPDKSLPILWAKTRNFNPLFYNEFGNLEKQQPCDNGEQLRTRLYVANTEFSQKLNKYIVNFLKNKAQSQGLSSWLRVDLIPKKVLEGVLSKFIADDQKNSEEAYFDFLDYKKIIEKHPELIEKFKLKSDHLIWLDKLNELRRDPAHPEKPAPSISDVEYYEKIKEEILYRI